MNFIFHITPFVNSGTFWSMVVVISGATLLLAALAVTLWFALVKKVSPMGGNRGGVLMVLWFTGALALIFGGINYIVNSSTVDYNQNITISNAQQQINDTYPLTLNRTDTKTLLGYADFGGNDVWSSRGDGQSVEKFGKVDAVLTDGTIVPIQLIRVNGKFEIVTPDSGTGFHELTHKK